MRIKVEPTIKEFGSIPRDNPIDKLLNRMIKACLLEEVTLIGYYDRDYWNYFCSFLTIDEMMYILNFEQRGNWNYVLYEECEIRYDKFVSSTLESSLYE